MAGQIFFVCGHSNWGKSMTLRPLTDGAHQGRWTEIGGTRIRVMKMSNDDRPVEEYAQDMERLLREHQRVLAALCPAFDRPVADPSELLASLRGRKYRLHFWVIEHKYDGGKSVSVAEIERLRTFGVVEVFSGRAESPERAQHLREFVQRNMD